MLNGALELKWEQNGVVGVVNIIKVIDNVNTIRINNFVIFVQVVNGVKAVSFVKADITVGAVVIAVSVHVVVWCKAW
jgi:hypothetical protein